MAETSTKDLGAVTAYGEALEAGYTGTYEQFCDMLANFAKRADEVGKNLTSAQASAQAAAKSQQAAAASEQNAVKSATAASASQSAAKLSETNASNSVASAKTSEKNALASKNAASASATAASDSATKAHVSEANAGKSATAASTSETNASKSATAAATSETNAASSVKSARSYSEGGTASRDGEDTDNAKYYMKRAQAAAEAASSGMKAATVASIGAVKPDDESIKMKADGTIFTEYGLSKDSLGRPIIYHYTHDTATA